MRIFDDITLHPLFPVSAVIGLGAIVLGLTIAAYLRARSTAQPMRRLLLTALRCVALAGLLLLLLRPMRAEPVANSGLLPILAVAVDQSASMKTADMNGESRDAAVRKTLSEARDVFERELADDFDVRFFSFSDAIEPLVLDELLQKPQPTGDTTDLSTTLFESATVPVNRRMAGLVLVSDGRDNAGGDVQRAATFMKSANAGVWAVPVGTSAEARDVYVTARLKQSFLYVNQSGMITVSVSHAGFDNQYVEVTLLRDGERIATESVALTDRNATVDFPVRETHKGMFRYRVEVAPLTNESDTENNSRTVFARVVDEKTKVLFVEARPYWDSKFLLRTLQNDPNLEVTSLFQLRADKVLAITEKSTTDPTVKSTVTQGVALPRTKEDLYQYDCLVLGKGVDTLLNAEQLGLVRDFVRERGGGVVFARGRSYGFDNEALAALEPLVWERDSVHGTRFQLTPEGRTNPAFTFNKDLPIDAVIRELPEMVSVTKVSQEKSLSVILARSTVEGSENELATIAYQRYGKGKVMSVGATGLWRWAIMPQELSNYDDVYPRFWGQMIRWLVSDSDFLPGQDISFRSDRYTYDSGDTVQLTVRTKFVDDATFAPHAVVLTPQGKEIRVSLEADPASPGSYTAGYLPDEEGEFEARLELGDAAPAVETEQVRFTVYSDSVESRFVSADPGLMADIAAITGGKTLSLDELDTLPELLTTFELQSRTEEKRVDAWDSLQVFSALIALLAVEWFVRRRSGLL
ncbi:MAG TPA: hypothetical protein PLJ47_11030 [Candidatus Hydrogenedentes bacterium]|nr:hypothetical protein [Candidatus Hydrogenedentota bacterium]